MSGYLNRAQREFPDYARRDAPCDVPGCAGMVDAGRALTWIAVDGTPATIYIRLCTEHTETPIAELVKLLPALPAGIDSTAYLDLRGGWGEGDEP